MQPFKLHAVLKYRKQIENKCRQDLFKALEKETVLKNQHDEKKNELVQLYKNLAVDKETGTTVTRLIMLDNRISFVKELANQAEQAYLKAAEQTEKKRKALLKASSDRRVMEKMEVRQNYSHDQYIKKKEMLMLDELAVLFHKR